MNTKNPNSEIDEKSEGLKWYQKNSGIILLILFLPPVGFYLLFKVGTWNRRTKLLVSIVVLAAIILTVIFFGIDSSQAWQNKIDKAKASLCDCREVAFEEKRDFEKQTKELEKCFRDFQRVYENLKEDKSISDSVFFELEEYMNTVYSEPCRTQP